MNSLLLLGLSGLVMAMDMDMDEDRIVFHPINPGTKTFHWITAIVLLLIVPSIGSVLAFANKFHWSLVLQTIATGFSVFETLFIDFPDNENNHEGRASKGTSWFLSALLGVTVFVGSFVNGSNFLVNKYYPSWKTSELALQFKAYKGLSFIVVLTAWVRVCLGTASLLGFCYGSHTGQCIAHGIMGLAFLGYSFILLMVLVIPWFRKSDGVSQEFIDSTVMMVWGIVNTFTEHRWGKEDWGMGDYQHTSMGIIWWSGGLLGMFLSRNNKRSFVPALLLVFTGYAMSEHAQHMAISTKVHGVFGLALMGAGFSRIMEISWFLQDKPCSESGKILSFQYFPPFCLALAGVMFMSATEEQLQLVHDLQADHSAYILVILSAVFIIFLWLILLLTLYLRLVGFDEDGELKLEYSGLHDFELDDLSDEREGDHGEESDDRFHE